MAIERVCALVLACLWAAPLEAAQVERISVEAPGAGLGASGLGVRLSLTAPSAPALSLGLVLRPQSLAMVPRLSASAVTPAAAAPEQRAPAAFDSLQRLAEHAEASRRSGKGDETALANRFFDQTGTPAASAVAPKLYRVIDEQGRSVLSETPGRYAGWKPGKIFGRLDCKSGMRMDKSNRVFFTSWQAAIKAGYRPCKKCKPTPTDSYASLGRPAPVPVHVEGLKFRDLNHVILFSRGRPKDLHKILAHPEFPSGVEVVGGDMGLIGWEGRLRFLYDEHLDAIKKRTTLARRSGDEALVERLKKEYRDRALEARGILKDFALRHAATGGIPKDILDLTREKSLRLWVGGPRYDQAHDKLFNSYFLIENGKVAGFHDKSTLYSIERDILDAPSGFDGAFKDKLILTCWEAEMLNPHYQKPVPEPLRQAKKAIAERPQDKPFLLYVDGYWPVAGGVGLRGQVSKAVRRGVGSDQRMGLRAEGALALVNNDGAGAYVMGPSREKGNRSRKAEVYGAIDRPGLLWIKSDANGDLLISKFDDSLKAVD